jgi:hypothetical protein
LETLGFLLGTSNQMRHLQLSVPFITVSLPNFHHGTQGTTIDPSNLGAWGACDTDPF